MRLYQGELHYEERPRCFITVSVTADTLAEAKRLAQAQVARKYRGFTHFVPVHQYWKSRPIRPTTKCAIVNVS